MDPDETLAMIDEALANEDFDEAEELTEDLHAWLLKGGFEPYWDEYPHAKGFCFNQWAY